MLLIKLIKDFAQFLASISQNDPVKQNLTAGILLSGENLVLQKVKRQYAGNFTCTAENELGVTRSNVVHLPVMCESVIRIFSIE